MPRVAPKQSHGIPRGRNGGTTGLRDIKHLATEKRTLLLMKQDSWRGRGSCIVATATEEDPRQIQRVVVDREIQGDASIIMPEEYGNKFDKITNGERRRVLGMRRGIPRLRSVVDLEPGGTEKTLRHYTGDDYLCLTQSWVV